VADGACRVASKSRLGQGCRFAKSRRQARRPSPSITGGAPLQVAGKTNFIKVERVE